jgi:hypothetical protein
MKKYLSFFCCIWLTWASLNGQCPTDLILSSQGQIDSFQMNYPGCIDIPGKLMIIGNDINELNGISNIASVGTDLNISNTIALTTLTGLESLTNIQGGLMLDSNFGLVTLAGLNNVTNIGGIYIENNNQLVNLSALSNVSSGLQYLVLQNNHSLLTLSGLENIDSIQTYLDINDNYDLISISELENLHFIGVQANIFGNNQLSLCSNINLCILFENTVAYILNNAPGCNSTDEVFALCNLLFSQVEGIMYADLNCNGTKENDEPFLTHHLLKRPNNLPYTSSDAGGIYTGLLFPQATNEFKPDSIPGYSTMPLFHSISTDETVQTYSGYDFRFCPDSLFHNLSVTLTSVTPPRPGFTHQYQICVENMGTYPEDAVLTFDFSGGASGDYVTITDPDGGEINGPTITWTLEDIPLFTPVCFTITVQMSPATPIGSIILPHAQIESADGFQKLHF